MAEFAINTTVNVSTGFSPFHLTYGTDPKSPIDLDVKESTTPAAEEFVKQMNDNINKARDNILKAQQSQKTQADKHRRDHTFQIGDQVMLSTKNLHFSTSSRKLLPRWVGPFNIVKQIHKDTFELDLRGTFHIHPTFHVALLKPYQENDPTIFPNRTQDPPALIIIDNEEEYHVKKILKHRKIGKKTQYLVQWEGYHIEDATWEPEQNLRNAKEIIADYKSSIKTLSVNMINITPTISRQNSFKRGDGYNKNSDIKSHQSNMMNTVDRNIQKFRQYRASRYVQVEDPQGNILLGFKDPGSNMVIYYIPGMMIMYQLHDGCHCPNCNMVTDCLNNLTEITYHD
jgi:hypothetical protein